MAKGIEKQAKEDGWPASEELEEGRFTKWCKAHGFEGPSKSCADEAFKSDDASVRGMASFYMNTVHAGAAGKVRVAARVHREPYVDARGREFDAEIAGDPEGEVRLEAGRYLDDGSPVPREVLDLYADLNEDELRAELREQWSPASLMYAGAGMTRAQMESWVRRNCKFAKKEGPPKGQQEKAFETLKERGGGHGFTECVEKFKGDPDVDDPEKFCGWMKSRGGGHD